MLTDKLWPIKAAHVALSSWERCLVALLDGCQWQLWNSYAWIGDDADVGVRVRSLERNSPSRMPILGRHCEQSPLKVLASMRIFLSAHRLEIPPGAGHSNFVKHFAWRAVPLSRSSSPPWRSHPTPSHLICASEQRSGALRVRVRSLTCFARRSDEFAPVIDACDCCSSRLVTHSV